MTPALKKKPALVPVSLSRAAPSDAEYFGGGIILGEVRGEEARTLLDSFNTGHGGSMATIHANSPVKALRRFAELAMRAHQQATRDDLAAEIGDSVSYVVQVSRYFGGRKVSEIAHIEGYDRASKTYHCETVYALRRQPCCQ